VKKRQETKEAKLKRLESYLEYLQSRERVVRQEIELVKKQIEEERNNVSNTEL
jgi:hypothetical protein